MEPLENWLRREWAAKGFCYDLFQQLEAVCLSHIRDGRSIDDLSILKLYALGKLCQSIQALLEDNPTTSYHQRMESALFPALTAAIADLDAGGIDAGSFRRLIAEVSNAPR